MGMSVLTHRKKISNFFTKAFILKNRNKTPKTLPKLTKKGLKNIVFQKCILHIIWSVLSQKCFLANLHIKRMNLSFSPPCCGRARTKQDGKYMRETLWNSMRQYFILAGSPF